MLLQGYIDASYERLVERLGEPSRSTRCRYTPAAVDLFLSRRVERLGEPNIFYEFKFKGYDISGEEFEITIASQYNGTWKVFASDPCAMEIVERKIQPIYSEKLP